MVYIPFVFALILILLWWKELGEWITHRRNKPDVFIPTIIILVYFVIIVLVVFIDNIPDHKIPYQNEKPVLNALAGITNSLDNAAAELYHDIRLILWITIILTVVLLLCINSSEFPENIRKGFKHALILMVVIDFLVVIILVAV